MNISDTMNRIPQDESIRLVIVSEDGEVEFQAGSLQDSMRKISQRENVQFSSLGLSRVLCNN